MPDLSMKEQDLLELYQLLGLYRQTYRDNGEKDLQGWLETVAQRYCHRTGGMDILSAKNPRGAGRKRSYTEEQDARIVLLLEQKTPFRRIACEVGCSLGHIQDVAARSKATG